LSFFFYCWLFGPCGPTRPLFSCMVLRPIKPSIFFSCFLWLLANTTAFWSSSFLNFFFFPSFLIIVLKSGPIQKINPGPGQPGTGTGPGWKKIKKKPGVTRLTRQVDPVTRLTRSKTRLQPVDFCFFFY
jgi:hypothetical protein